MQKSTVGGIFAIISSSIGLLSGLMLLLTLSFTSREELYAISVGADVSLDFVIAVYTTIGLFLVLLGVLGIIGGVLAIKRNRLGWALTGAIASSISFFPLGLTAVVLVSMAHQEFKKPESLVPSVLAETPNKLLPSLFAVHKHKKRG